MATPTQCLSPAKVADLLDCTTDHVYDLLHDGRLAGVRIGARRWSIPVSSYEDFIASRSTAVAS